MSERKSFLSLEQPQAGRIGEPFSAKDLYRMTAGRLYPPAVLDRERSRDVPDALKILFRAIYTRIGENDSCWPGENTLAQDTGKGEKSVRKYLHQLVERKLIAIRVRYTGPRKRFHAYVPLWHEIHERAYVTAREAGKLPDDRQHVTAREAGGDGHDRQTESENEATTGKLRSTTGNLLPGNSFIGNSFIGNSPTDRIEERPPDADLLSEEPKRPAAPSPSEDKPEKASRDNGDGNAAALTWLRGSLLTYPGRPEVSLDDRICTQILAAANGASLSEIGDELRRLHRAGERPRSWGFFVFMIRKRFRPGQAEHHPDRRTSSR